MINRINFIALFLSIITIPSIAQNTYWQQKVEYQMEIDMNVETHQYEGKQKIIYYNNSPDTINKIYFHLYFNAFQPGSMMDVRSTTIADPDSRVGDRISNLKDSEIGYHHIETLKADKKDINFIVEGTILSGRLNKPLYPNEKTVLEMTWNSQVPLQVRRSGRDSDEGIDYTMTQWYPKLSEYDQRGWHPNPYIGREFHGVWGDFDVKITIDTSYTIGGSGYLQNADKIGHGYGDNIEKLQGKDGQHTWHFKAPQVHDFAWAADPDYTHTTAQVPNGPKLHFFYQPGEKTNENWSQLPEYMIEAFDIMNRNFGVYPYEQYSFIQGGDGGMEYPMCTMITGERSLGSLVGVGVHELVHSWFQGVLATNESLYPWMDEGFTSYASDIVMQQLFNSEPGEMHRGSYNAYFFMAESGNEEPLSTHADHYKTNRSYGINAYSKGAVFLHQLSYVMGHELFMEAMKRYFNDFKFKHPTDQDFIRTMEKVSDMELDWYLEHFAYSTNTIDYGINAIVEKDGATYITLERNDPMMMPIDLLVEMKNGTNVIHYIPLRIMRGSKDVEYIDFQRVTHEPWPWTNPTYTLKVNAPASAISRLIIDPSQRMADINPENNILDIGEYTSSYSNPTK